ncbi:MAG: YceI family protein [Rudaea sp.]
MSPRIAILFFALPGVALAAQESYVLDPTHSQVAFETRHLGFSTQRGHFAKSSAKVTLDRAAKRGTVDVTIDATSIHTQDPMRLDAIVKGEKYFNVDKYPTITFTSSDVRFDGDKVVAVDGELTMLGVTKPVVLKVDHFRCGEHSFNKKPMCGGDATAVIKRSEWGMTAGLPYSPADEVTIVVPIEAFRVEP